MKALPPFWTHVESGVKSRDEAVQALWAFYRKYPGKRRLDPEQAFEVYRSKQDAMGNYILYVRRRREKGEPILPPAEGEPTAWAAVVRGPRVKGSSARVQCPTCTFWRIPGKVHIANGKPCEGLMRTVAPS